MEVRGINAKKTFGTLRNYYLWAIGWQRTTGKILAAYKRTREAGLEKLDDAKEREEAFREWTGKEKE